MPAKAIVLRVTNRQVGTIMVCLQAAKNTAYNRQPLTQASVNEIRRLNELMGSIKEQREARR